jgi:hypothetical protein
MNLKNIFTFPFKRVNPFPGLAIDADTWRDAHNYSRDQQRLHNLLFHEIGIIDGLGVTANEPSDLSVNIQPGIAIDPEGNTIIVPNIYHYQIQNRDTETIYLIIQFREILEGPYQPPEGGQPTRIVDGYRIQERDNLPEEPYLELARIDFDTAAGAIRNADNKLQPGKNEIDLNFRKEVAVPSRQTAAENAAITPPEIINLRKKIVIGHVALSGNGSSQHIHGLRNIVREMEMRYNWEIELVEDVALDNNIGRFSMLYIAGDKGFKLDAEQQASLEDFVKSRGVLVAEDCSETETKNSTVHDELTDKLKLKLKPVNQGDPLLSNLNVFSEIPPGAQSGVFLKDNTVIYSDNDYGCAWQGGYKGSPLSRDIIRSAFEIGANIIEFAYNAKTSVRKKTPVSTG